MTVPPIINVLISGSAGTTTVVTEISENHVGIVVGTGSLIQTNVHTAPSAFAQHAYNATTASNAITASYALFAESSTGVIASSSYALFAESSSWATQALSSSYAPVFPYIGDAQITGSLEISNTMTANSVTLNADGKMFVITSSVSTGIFGVTENINPIIPTSSFSGAMIEYMAQRSTGLRMGIVMALWSGSTYQFTDVSTTDIGDTSDLIAGFLPVGEDIIFQVHSVGSGSGEWTVQAMFKLFPKLT